MLLEYTLEELWEEYYTYAIDEDPQEEFVGMEGENIIIKTGDPEVDRVQEKIAKGEEVDLLKEWMDEADREKVKKIYERRAERAGKKKVEDKG